MRYFILIFCLSFLLESAHAEKTIIPEATSKFEIVKEKDLNIWKLTKSEFHIRSFSFRQNSGGYWRKTLLILEETVSKTHAGIPMLDTNLKLTAWELTEENVLGKLWEISAEADSWEDKGPEIILTDYGCCGEPDKVYKYSTANGTKIGENSARSDPRN